MIEHYGYQPLHDAKPPVSEKRMREVLSRRYAESVAAGVDAERVLGRSQLPRIVSQADVAAKPAWTPYAWRHADGRRFLLLEKRGYGAFRDDATGTRKCLGFADTRDEALKLFEAQS